MRMISRRGAFTSPGIAPRAPASRLTSLQEFFRPTTIHRGCNAYALAQLGDVLLTSLSFQHDVAERLERNRQSPYAAAWAVLIPSSPRSCGFCSSARVGVIRNHVA